MADFPVQEGLEVAAQEGQVVLLGLQGLVTVLVVLPLPWFVIYVFGI